MSTVAFEREWIAAVEGCCPNVPDELLKALYPEIWAYGPQAERLIDVSGRISKAVSKGYSVPLITHLEHLIQAGILGLTTVSGSHKFREASKVVFGSDETRIRIHNNLQDLVMKSVQSGHQYQTIDAILNKALFVCMAILAIDIPSDDRSLKIIRQRWASDIQIFLELL